MELHETREGRMHPLSMQAEIIERINNMSHLELCKLWREAPFGDPMFDTTLPYAHILNDRLFHHFGGFTPEISKLLPPKQSFDNRPEAR